NSTRRSLYKRIADTVEFRMREIRNMAHADTLHRTINSVLQTKRICMAKTCLVTIHADSTKQSLTWVKHHALKHVCEHRLEQTYLVIALRHNAKDQARLRTPSAAKSKDIL